MNLSHLGANIDLLLEFARLPLSIAAYEGLAAQRGLRVVTDDIAPEYRLIKHERFGLMLMEGRMARLHLAGLFTDEDETSEADALGISLVSSGDQLATVHDHVLALLQSRLGPATTSMTWQGQLPMESDDLLLDHECSCHTWSFEETLLILLMNDEGDGHIGELATLDLRIAPQSCEDGLPDSIKEPWC